jgi:chromosome segregation ATPase
MNESDDFQMIVEQAKRFSEMFGALTRVGDILSEIGDLRHAESEARQALTKVQRELAILNSERGAAYQRIHDAIEAELKFRYKEYEKLLANESTLRASVANLTEKDAELRGRLADYERRTAQAEARHADATNKISVLRTSLDR